MAICGNPAGGRGGEGERAFLRACAWGEEGGGRRRHGWAWEGCAGPGTGEGWWQRVGIV